MKLKLALPIIFFISISLHAQYNQMVEYNKFDNDDSIIVKNKVSEVATVTLYYNSKGKTSSNRSIYQFTEKGLLNMYIRFSDSSSKAKIDLFNYALRNPHNDIYFRNKGPRYNTISKYATYNEHHQVTCIYNYKKSGKLTSINTFTYKDSFIHMSHYFDKKNRLTQYFVYDYSKGKLKNTSLYSRKHKLIRFWNYECDDIGTIHKSKDTTSYCTSKTYTNDGKIISSTVSFDYRGEPFKWVTVQDSNLKILESNYYHGKDEELKYHIEYTYINNKIASRYYWDGNIKGKHLSSKFTRYNALHQIIEENDTNNFSKKPIITSSKYTYNEQGLVTEIMGYKQNRLFSYKTFKYTFYRRD